MLADSNQCPVDQFSREGAGGRDFTSRLGIGSAPIFLFLVLLLFLSIRPEKENE